MIDNITSKNFGHSLMYLSEIEQILINLSSPENDDPTFLR